jgi:hypothetical protein
MPEQGATVVAVEGPKEVSIYRPREEETTGTKRPPPATSPHNKVFEVND